MEAWEDCCHNIKYLSDENVWDEECEMKKGRERIDLSVYTDINIMLNGEGNYNLEERDEEHGEEEERKSEEESKDYMKNLDVNYSEKSLQTSFPFFFLNSSSPTCELKGFNHVHESDNQHKHFFSKQTKAAGAKKIMDKGFSDKFLTSMDKNEDACFVKDSHLNNDVSSDFMHNKHKGALNSTNYSNEFSCTAIESSVFHASLCLSSTTDTERDNVRITLNNNNDNRNNSNNNNNNNDNNNTHTNREYNENPETDLLHINVKQHNCLSFPKMYISPPSSSSACINYPEQLLKNKKNKNNRNAYYFASLFPSSSSFPSCSTDVSDFYSFKPCSPASSHAASPLSFCHLKSSNSLSKKVPPPVFSNYYWFEAQLLNRLLLSVLIEKDETSRILTLIFLEEHAKELILDTLQLQQTLSILYDIVTCESKFDVDFSTLFSSCGTKEAVAAKHEDGRKVLLSAGGRGGFAGCGGNANEEAGVLSLNNSSGDSSSNISLLRNNKYSLCDTLEERKLEDIRSCKTHRNLFKSAIMQSKESVKTASPSGRTNGEEPSNELFLNFAMNSGFPKEDEKEMYRSSGSSSNSRRINANYYEKATRDNGIIGLRTEEVFHSSSLSKDYFNENYLFSNPHNNSVCTDMAPTIGNVSLNPSKIFRGVQKKEHERRMVEGFSENNNNNPYHPELFHSAQKSNRASKEEEAAEQHRVKLLEEFHEAQNSTEDKKAKERNINCANRKAGIMNSRAVINTTKKNECKVDLSNSRRYFNKQKAVVTSTYSMAVRCHAMIAYTTLLITFDCLNILHEWFECFVDVLYQVINTVNNLKDAAFRYFACECLMELEINYPGLLVPLLGEEWYVGKEYYESTNSTVSTQGKLKGSKLGHLFDDEMNCINEAYAKLYFTTFLHLTENLLQENNLISFESCSSMNLKPYFVLNSSACRAPSLLPSVNVIDENECIRYADKNETRSSKEKIEYEKATEYDLHYSPQYNESVDAVSDPCYSSALYDEPQLQHVAMKKRSEEKKTREDNVFFPNGCGLSGSSFSPSSFSSSHTTDCQTLDNEDYVNKENNTNNKNSNENNFMLSCFMEEAHNSTRTTPFPLDAQMLNPSQEEALQNLRRNTNFYNKESTHYKEFQTIHAIQDAYYNRNLMLLERIPKTITGEKKTEKNINLLNRNICQSTFNASAPLNKPLNYFELSQCTSAVPLYSMNLSESNCIPLLPHSFLKNLKRAISIILECFPTYSDWTRIYIAQNLPIFIKLLDLPCSAVIHHFQSLLHAIPLTLVHAFLLVTNLFPNDLPQETIELTFRRLISIIHNTSLLLCYRLLTVRWLIYLSKNKNFARLLYKNTDCFCPLWDDPLELKELKLQALLHCFEQTNSIPKNVLCVLECLNEFKYSARSIGAHAVVFRFLLRLLLKFGTKMDHFGMKSYLCEVLRSHPFVLPSVLAMIRQTFLQNFKSIGYKLLESLGQFVSTLEPPSRIKYYFALLVTLAQTSAISPSYVTNALRRLILTPVEPSSWNIGMRLLVVCRQLMLYHPQSIIYESMNSLLHYFTKYQPCVDLRDWALLYLKLLNHAGTDKLGHVLCESSEAYNRIEKHLTFVLPFTFRLKDGPLPFLTFEKSTEERNSLGLFDWCSAVFVPSYLKFDLHLKEEKNFDEHDRLLQHQDKTLFYDDVINSNTDSFTSPLKGIFSECAKIKHNFNENIKKQQQALYSSDVFSSNSTSNKVYSAEKDNNKIVGQQSNFYNNNAPYNMIKQTRLSSIEIRHAFEVYVQQYNDSSSYISLPFRLKFKEQKSIEVSFSNSTLSYTLCSSADDINVKETDLEVNNSKFYFRNLNDFNCINDGSNYIDSKNEKTTYFQNLTPQKLRKSLFSDDNDIYKSKKYFKNNNFSNFQNKRNIFNINQPNCLHNYANNNIFVRHTNVLHYNRDTEPNANKIGLACAAFSPNICSNENKIGVGQLINMIINLTEIYAIKLSFSESCDYQPIQPVQIPFLMQTLVSKSNNSNILDHMDTNSFPFVYKILLKLRPLRPAPTTFNVYITFNDAMGHTYMGQLETFFIAFQDLFLPIRAPVYLWAPFFEMLWKEPQMCHSVKVLEHDRDIVMQLICMTLGPFIVPGGVNTEREDFDFQQDEYFEAPPTLSKHEKVFVSFEGATSPNCHPRFSDEISPEKLRLTLEKKKSDKKLLSSEESVSLKKNYKIKKDKKFSIEKQVEEANKSFASSLEDVQEDNTSSSSCFSCFSSFSNFSYEDEDESNTIEKSCSYEDSIFSETDCSSDWSSMSKRCVSSHTESCSLNYVENEDIKEKKKNNDKQKAVVIMNKTDVEKLESCLYCNNNNNINNYIQENTKKENMHHEQEKKQFNFKMKGKLVQRENSNLEKTNFFTKENKNLLKKKKGANYTNTLSSLSSLSSSHSSFCTQDQKTFKTENHSTNKSKIDKLKEQTHNGKVNNIAGTKTDIETVYTIIFLPPKHHLLIKFSMSKITTVVRMATDRFQLLSYMDDFFASWNRQASKLNQSI